MSRNLDEKKSDYLLELALEEQLDNDKDMRYWEQLEAENPPHVFSERHNKRMRKVFRKAKRVEFYEEYRKRVIRTVAGFLIIFCASVVTVTQVEAFRLPLVEFFSQIKQKSTLFGVATESRAKLTKNFQGYKPTYRPEGFTVTEIYEDKDEFFIKYEDGKGNTYRFCFFSRFKDFALDTEEAVASNIEINGRKVSIVEKGNKTKVIMYDENVLFYLEGAVSPEEACKIMEGVP